MYAASERLMVDQLVAHIGWVEKNRRDGSDSTRRNRLLATSIEIGKACVKLSKPSARRGDYMTLMGPPRRALELLGKDRKLSPKQKHQVRMLGLSALLIENRNFPSGVQNVQKRLQHETATQLAGTMTAIKRLRGRRDEMRRGDLVGQLTELTCLGLLNYGEPLDHFGALSLTHHDQMRDGRNNQDLVFVQTTMGEEMTQALQTKSRCESFCGEEGYDDRIRYSSDIALISGHCDLGLEVSKLTKRVDFMVPKLIVKSIFEPQNMWTREQRELGAFSEALVHTIVHDGATTRAGTAK